MIASTRQRRRLATAIRQWGVVMRQVRNAEFFLRNVEIEVPCADEARNLAEHALDWARQVRAAMSRLDPDGEVWRMPTPAERELEVALVDDLARRAALILGKRVA